MKIENVKIEQMYEKLSDGNLSFFFIFLSCQKIDDIQEWMWTYCTYLPVVIISISICPVLGSVAADWVDTLQDEGRKGREEQRNIVEK